MIKYLSKYLVAFILTAVIFLTGVMVAINTEKVFGTVEFVSSGSRATSTYYATVSKAGGSVLLKGRTSAVPGGGTLSGVLENLIVMGGSKTGTVSFYDATTSDVTLRLGQRATTSIILAEFPGGIASTTFEMNMEFKTGLLMVVTGIPATSTVTWK